MLMVFDTQLLQYRVPAWRGVEKQRPGARHEVYLSDCLVRDDQYTGFWNQTVPAPHHLAMDIMVLSSRGIDQVWAQVANEAMQADYAVVVSDAVGSGADFSSRERLRAFKKENPSHPAKGVEELSKFRRNFSWANEKWRMCSMKATVHVLIAALSRTAEQNNAKLFSGNRIYQP